MLLFLYRVLCGFLFGIGMFAPGVSGSVLMVLTGIYPQMLDLTANPFKHLKKNILFLIPLGIGAAISLVLFVFVFSFLFKTYALAATLLFAGLIAGNLPFAAGEALKGGFRARYLLAAVVAFALAAGFSFLSYLTPPSANPGLLTFSLGGALAGAAGLVPGMSVSMILLALGVYEPLLAALRGLDWLVIFFTAGCFVLSSVALARLIRFVLNRWKNLAYAAVAGLMAGSLADIFLSLPSAYAGFNWYFGILLCLCGLAVSLLFVYLGGKFNPEKI
ncbi:MAG: DUF368 domain-containing protein [Defluviitaleaceae bacterium]|nr:DUF368 domain-containing protein [Defluviitaleaceae bacterium]